MKIDKAFSDQARGGFKHDAFASYATKADYRLVRAIEKFVESFHLNIPKRELPLGIRLHALELCVDGSDFSLAGTVKRVEQEQSKITPTGEIERLIVAQLEQCRYLLLFCHGQEASSPWTDFELDWFLKNRGADHVFLAVTGGSTPWEPCEAFFPSSVIKANLHHKIWYDFREFSRKEAKQAQKLRDFDDERTRLAADLNGASAGEIAKLYERERRRRQRLGFFIALGLAAIFAAVAAVAVWQWDRATREQARAEVNERAEKQRSKELRQLISRLLYEIDPKLSGIPGTTEARKILADNAVLYLDGLTKATATEPDLTIELLLAYDHVGGIVGNPSTANVGDSAKALSIYQQILAQSEKIAVQQPENAAAQETVAVGLRRVGDVLRATGRLGEADAYYRRSLQIMEKVEAKWHDGNSARYLAASYESMGDALRTPVPGPEREGRLHQAVDYYSKALGIRRQLLAKNDANTEMTCLLSETLVKLGNIQKVLHSTNDAMGNIREGLNIAKRLNDQFPNDIIVGKCYALANEQMGNVLMAMPSPPLLDAFWFYGEAVDVYKEMAARDVHNAQAANDVWVVERTFASSCMELVIDPARSATDRAACYMQLERILDDAFKTADDAKQKGLWLPAEDANYAACQEIRASLMDLKKQTPGTSKPTG